MKKLKKDWKSTFEIPVSEQLIGQIVGQEKSGRDVLELLKSNKTKSPTELLDKHIGANPIPPVNEFVPNYVRDEKLADMTLADLDDRTPEQKKQEENSEDEIYSIKNFSI